MDEAPTIFAVIPVHNRVEQTLRCLESLRDSSVRATAVVVDDGSSDGTADKVVAAFAQTVILPGSGDLWWAGATNVGVQYALAEGADYVLTLNNDGVVAPDAVGWLLQTARAIPHSLVAARRNDLAHPDIPWSDGWSFSWAGFRLASAVTAQPDTPTRIDGAGANLLLIPARCFAEIGLFDAAALPQCYCDWDFQLRAAKHGWTVYCEPRAVVLVDRTPVGVSASDSVDLSHAATMLTSTRSGLQPVYLTRFVARHVPARKRALVAGRVYMRLVRMVVRHYRRAVARRLHRRPGT